LPQYLLTLLAYLATVYYYESIKKQESDNEALMLDAIIDQDAHVVLNWLAFINIICTCSVIFTICYQSWNPEVRKLYWSTIYSKVDAIYSVSNLLVSILIVTSTHNSEWGK
jgi:hypothetical protein